MRVKLIIVVCLFLLSTVAYGCVPFIVGSAAGALGGYAISNDTIQGESDKDYDALWNSAKRVARTKGTIMEEDVAQGFLRLEGESGYAIIRLIRLTKATNRLKVSARKMGFPNMRLAEDIFVKILGDV